MSLDKCKTLISRDKDKAVRISFALNLFFVCADASTIYELALTCNIQGDVETLKKYCSPQLIERCKAEHSAYKSHGIFFDNKVGL